MLITLNLGLNFRKVNYIQFSLLGGLYYKNKDKTSPGMITRETFYIFNITSKATSAPKPVQIYIEGCVLGSGM